MPNAVSTLASSASDTTGQPIPLGYGYLWVAGKRQEYYQLQDTGNSTMDYTRLGIWLLGHGEWDGCTELWINDLLVWEGGGTNTTFAPSATPPSGFSGQEWVGALDGGPPMVFNFHAGTDSIIGSGFVPNSSGPDQGCDVLWAQFPSAIQPLDYSRIAYYTLMRKQPIQNQTNTHQNDPSQWTDIAPVGLWRGIKCRLFDDEGNQTGYAFTTNPAWQIVDVILRRKIFPDYALDKSLGPDPLNLAIQNRFDWGSIYTAAQYFDQILANGRRRFQFSGAFSQQTTLQAVLEQMMLCCRSFVKEYAGKISINCDAPRASVFTFSREHILPGSWDADDATLHTSANRYVATFRDLLVPQCAVIASIVTTLNGNPVVTTEEPHPFIVGDRIAIGGTGTTYDGEWEVYSVPAVTNIGTPAEVDPTTLTLVRKGSNYPASVGPGGGMGLLYSRFSARYPEFWHKANMLARGAVGLGIARQREKVKQTLDFATSTYDQASRLTTYERDRLLGIDTTGANGQLTAPYITPPAVRLRTSFFARDVNGNLAAAIEPGDHVTIDDTVDFQYAGEYEVLDGLEKQAPGARASGEGGAIALTPDESSGEIAFVLGPYNEAVMYDTSDPNEAGWLDVPGSDPGNDSNYTQVALASGGNFVFFSGIAPTGTQFQLPSTGYPTGNMLAWASAAGANIDFHTAHVIQACEVSVNRLLTLIYADDDGFTWGGDVGYAAVTWLSADVVTVSGGLSWIEFTLLGGEEICFGQGILADGDTVPLPAGFTSDKMFALAFVHDMPPSSHNMYLVGAYVDGAGVVHVDASDDVGNTWHGNASVLVFAWKNNMGTVVLETIGGANWTEIPLSDGTNFGVGCQKAMPNGGTFELPSAAGDGSTLQAIAGSSDGMYEPEAHHAQGVGACYLDADNVVHISFQDGTGDTWYGAADVFAVYCAPGTAPPTLVTVTVASFPVAAGATQLFTAVVTGIPDHDVTWSVDGIAGGNVAVGTIDSTGLYGAPNSAGTHTITATSVADPTASGSATATVFGSVILPGSVLTTNSGDIIYDTGTDVIYVE